MGKAFLFAGILLSVLAEAIILDEENCRPCTKHDDQCTTVENCLTDCGPNGTYAEPTCTTAGCICPSMSVVGIERTPSHPVATKRFTVVLPNSDSTNEYQLVTNDCGCDSTCNNVGPLFIAVDNQLLSTNLTFEGQPAGNYLLCLRTAASATGIAIDGFEILERGATNFYYTSSPNGEPGQQCTVNAELTIEGVDLQAGDRYYLQYPSTVPCNSNTPSTMLTADNIQPGGASTFTLFDYPESGSSRVCYKAVGQSEFSSLGPLTVQVLLPPTIESITGCGGQGLTISACQTNGSDTLTIQGTMLQPDSKVLVGNKPCSSVQFLSPETIIVGGCTGTGYEQRLAVYTPNGFYSMTTANVSFNPKPSVAQIKGCRDVFPTTADCPSQGAVITVMGTNFGNQGQVYIDNKPCPSLVGNSTHLICSGHFHDRANGDAVSLVVKNEFHEELQAYNIYFTPVPIVTGVYGCRDNSNTTHTKRCPTDGTLPVTVTGQGFDSFGMVHVYVGATKCQYGRVLSDREVVCLFYAASGAQATSPNHVIRVQVEAEMSTSTHVYLSYSKQPSITNITGCDLQEAQSTVGCDIDGQPVIINGKNFEFFDPQAVSPFTGWIKFGDFECTSYGAVTSTSVECLDFSGSGKNNFVYLSSDGEVAPLNTNVRLSFKEACPVDVNGLLCSGHGTCNKITRTCNCRAGSATGYWNGTECDKCLSGYFGSVCQSKCPGVGPACSGHGICSDGKTGNGKCSCDPVNEFRGEGCQYQCPRGLGLATNSVCSDFDCRLPEDLTSPSGVCVCPQGNWDAACYDCAEGFYGPQCEGKCDCVQGTCSQGTSGTGVCTCKELWNGDRCDVKCAEGNKWNPGSEQCEPCDPVMNSPYCNVTCQAPCGPEQPDKLPDCWDGGCYEPCTVGYFKANCTGICPGLDPAVNESKTICYGRGNCSDGRVGTGICTCQEPFVGNGCQGECPVCLHGSCSVDTCKCVNPDTDEVTDDVTNCLPEHVKCECKCNDGWAGPTCSIPCPNGTDLNGALATCSGLTRGYCHDGNDGNGTCTCQYGYGGDNCGLSCPSDDNGFCYGNGECVAQTVRTLFGTITTNLECLCDTTHNSRFDQTANCSSCQNLWFGPKCNLTCDPQDCSGHGQCTMRRSETVPSCKCAQRWKGAKCDDCDTGYWGPNCDNECPGGACTPCSNHGNCSQGVNGTGTCTCDLNFDSAVQCTQCVTGKFGYDCDLECPKNDAGSDCFGHGTCYYNVTVKQALCACRYDSSNGFWTGGQCDECASIAYGANCLPCQGYSDITNTVCSGHGLCANGKTGSGTCTCQTNVTHAYWGTTCKERCAIWPPVTGKVCNGHGTCNQATGACSCMDDSDGVRRWEGTICYNCTYGFFGPQCTGECPGAVVTDGSFSSVCSGNGECSAGVFGDGKCTCTPGYMALDCSQKCPSAVPGGIWCNGRGLGCDQLTGVCECMSNPEDGFWSGTECQECQAGYTGTRCTETCDTVSALKCHNPFCETDTSACTCDNLDLLCSAADILGLVSQTGDCADCGSAESNKCPDYTYGENCDQQCPGIITDASGIVKPCNGFGLCQAGKIGSGECECYRNYWNDVNGTGVCGGECQPCTPNQGECNLDNGNCDCFNGYWGESCDQKCPGVESSLICGGHGECGAHNTNDPTWTCKCSSGYWGDNCDKACAPSVDNPCYGHGECVQDTGECLCDTNPGTYGGATCQFCADGWAGVGCTKQCMNGTAQTVFPYVCACYEHYWGEICDGECPGLGTETGVCGGEDHGFCDSGNRTEGGGTGICSCLQSKGWYGEDCDVLCQADLVRDVDGTNGGCRVDSTQVPPEQQHFACDNAGQCVCEHDADLGFWDGELCDACSVGYWGVGSCNLKCPCSSHGSCHISTASCDCFQDAVRGYWTGTRCSDCSPGWVGTQCTSSDVAVTRSHSLFGYDVPLLESLAALREIQEDYELQGTVLFDPVQQVLVSTTTPMTVMNSDPDCNTNCQPLGHPTAGYLYCDGKATVVDAQFIGADRSQLELKISRLIDSVGATYTFDWPGNATDATENGQHLLDLSRATSRVPAVNGDDPLCLNIDTAQSLHKAPAAKAMGRHRRQMRALATSTTYSFAPTFTYLNEDHDIRWYSENIELMKSGAVIGSVSLSTVNASLDASMTLVGFTSLMVHPELQRIWVGVTYSGRCNRETPNIMRSDIFSISLDSLFNSNTNGIEYTFKEYHNGVTSQAGDLDAWHTCTIPTDTPAIIYNSVPFMRIYNPSDSRLEPSLVWMDPNSTDVYIFAFMLTTTVDSVGVAVIKGVGVVRLKYTSDGKLINVQLASLMTAEDNPKITAVTLDYMTQQGDCDLPCGAIYLAFNSYSGTTSSPSILLKIRMSDLEVFGTINFLLRRTPGNLFPEIVLSMDIDEKGRALYALAPAFTFQVITINIFAIESISPTIADTRGGTLITIHGEGFVPTDDLTCIFGTGPTATLDTNVTYINHTTIVCRTTEGSDDDCLGRAVELSLYGVNTEQKPTNNDRRLKRAAAPQLQSVDPLQGSMATETVVTVEGYGFQNTSYLKCRFFSEPDDPSRAQSWVSTAVTFVSSSQIKCLQPKTSAPSEIPSFVTVSLDGQQYSSTIPYQIIGTAANISASSDNDPSAWCYGAVCGFRIDDGQLPDISIHIIDEASHKLGTFATTSLTVKASIEGIFTPILDQYQAEEDAIQQDANAAQSGAVQLKNRQFKTQGMQRPRPLKHKLSSRTDLALTKFAVQQTEEDPPCEAATWLKADGTPWSDDYTEALKPAGWQEEDEFFPITMQIDKDSGVATFSNLSVIKPTILDDEHYYSVLFEVLDNDFLKWKTRIYFDVAEGSIDRLCFTEAPGNIVEVDEGSMYFVNSNGQYTVRQPVLVRVDAAGNKIKKALQSDESAEIKVIQTNIHIIDQTITPTSAQPKAKLTDHDFRFFKATINDALHGAEYVMNFTVTYGTRKIFIVSEKIIVGPCGLNSALTLGEAQKYEEQKQYAVVGTRECKACPPHALCNGEIYFRVQDGYYRKSNNSVHLTECNPKDACKSGLLAVCANGYEEGSVLCATCFTGYGKDSKDNCIACPSAPVINWLWLFLMTVIVFSFLILVVYSSLRPKNNEVLPILARILVNHLQVCGRAGDMERVAVAAALDRFLKLQEDISEINPNILSLDCITGWGYHQKWIIYMSLPFILVVIATIGISLLAAWRHAYRQTPIGQLPLPPSGKLMEPHQGYDREGEEVRPPSPPTVEGLQIDSGGIHDEVIQSYNHFAIAERNRQIYDARLKRVDPKLPLWRIFVCTIVVVLFLLYPTLVEQCANIFSCKDVFDGPSTNATQITQSRYLTIDLAIDCDSEKHQTLQRVALIFGGIYGLGIPLGVVLAVAACRMKVGKEESMRIFSFLVRGFHSRWWFWEATIMLRKMILVAIVVGIRQPTLQAYCFMWVIEIALVAHLLADPYIEEVLYNMEALSLSSIAVTANLVLLFQLDGNNTSDWRLSLLEAFLIIVNSMVVLYLLFWTLIEAKKKIKEITSNNMAEMEEASKKNDLQEMSDVDRWHMLHLLNKEKRFLIDENIALRNSTAMLRYTLQESMEDNKEMAAFLNEELPKGLLLNLADAETDMDGDNIEKLAHLYDDDYERDERVKKMFAENDLMDVENDWEAEWMERQKKAFPDEVDKKKQWPTKRPSDAPAPLEPKDYQPTKFTHTAASRDVDQKDNADLLNLWGAPLQNTDGGLQPTPFVWDKVEKPKPITNPLAPNKGMADAMEPPVKSTKDASVQQRPLYKFRNGDSYEGEWKDKMMHGYGKYQYAQSGNIYEGNYENHIKHGYGVFTYQATGIVHSGMWANGVKDGPGTTKFPNGDMYTGDFKDNEFCGQGQFVHASGDRYVGQWKASSQCGEGTMYYADGSIYQGQWADGKKHGFGKYTTSSSTYEGTWKDGVMDGKGLQVFEDGSKFKGEFLSGVREGQGEFTDYDGSVYSGSWKDNQRHGKASYRYSNGAVCQGEWLNNEIHGHGIYTAIDGTSMAVEYEHGKCVRKTAIAQQ